MTEKDGTEGRGDRFSFKRFGRVLHFGNKSKILTSHELVRLRNIDRDVVEELDLVFETFRKSGIFDEALLSHLTEKIGNVLNVALFLVEGFANNGGDELRSSVDR